MNKILALDPMAIENSHDWYKIYPHVGHSKGLFIASFPKSWAREFLSKDLDYSTWGFWDQEKLKNFLKELEETNSFISLRAPYKNSLAWAKNYIATDAKRKEGCIAFAARNESFGLKTLDDLVDPRQLDVESTIHEDISAKTLVENLKIFFQNTPKIALVDRHNYLISTSGKSTQFVEFLRELLKITSSSKCHEILVYAKYDPVKYPYMASNESVHAQLANALRGCITPTYGVKYMCCAEYSNRQDLHARRIVTTNIVFVLSDSISGKTYSQSVTRVPDVRFREVNMCAWIDEEHGLDVKSSAVFKNFKGI